MTKDPKMKEKYEKLAKTVFNQMKRNPVRLPKDRGYLTAIDVYMAVMEWTIAQYGSEALLDKMAMAREFIANALLLEGYELVETPMPTDSVTSEINFVKKGREVELKTSDKIKEPWL